MDLWPMVLLPEGLDLGGTHIQSCPLPFTIKQEDPGFCTIEGHAPVCELWILQSWITCFFQSRTTFLR